MEWYINDLSLSGGFADHHEFRNSVEPLLRLMARRSDLRRRILCSRTLSTRPATMSMNLAECVRATKDQLFIRQVLGWLSTAGPFWDDDRAANPDDLFYFEGEDVTDQGLGEAARRLALEMNAGTFSFPHPTVSRFERTPLSVEHGLQEQPLGSYDVGNLWNTRDIEAAAIRSPHSWTDMVAIATAEMNGMILSSEIANQLAPVPFHSGVAEKFLLLLRVLQKLTDETRDGALTEAGLELLKAFFIGEKALFTDESDTNKRDFAGELTFPDPSNPKQILFCPWHGKVKFGSQYRIHFEWPRPKGQTRIKVAYIGPKIAKR
jgi:hypothetical protein